MTDVRTASCRSRLLRRASACAALTLMLAVNARAQASAPLVRAPQRVQRSAHSDSQAVAERLTLSGHVLDALSGAPIGRARLSVTPRFRSCAAEQDQCARNPREVTTTDQGLYQITGLTPGDYEIQIRALGYQPRTIEISLSVEPGPVSLALRHVPVYLARVEVTAAGYGTFTSRPDPANDDHPIAVERLRQRRFPESDTRLVVERDLAAAVSPIQRDIFRALHRVPGVAARDDYSAELRVRGSPWSHTRVSLDGLPILNPLHAAGAVAAINSSVLGEVRFHPGVQPVGSVDGAAGQVALTTRHASRGNRASGELSILSAGLTLEDAGTDGGWLIAMRRSHIDLLSRAAAAARSDPTLVIPYAFGDVVVRADRTIGRRLNIEVSGIEARNELTGGVRGVVSGERAYWGTRAARMTIGTPVAGGVVRTTIGGSLYRAMSSPETDRNGPAGPGYHLQDSRSKVAIRFAESQWTRAEATTRSVTIGLRVTASASGYLTSGEWPRDSIPGDTLQGGGSLRMISSWVDRLWALGPLALRTAMKWDVGGESPLLPSSRFSPRLAARMNLGPATALTASHSRVWQYEQALALSGSGQDAIATSSLFWVVAGAEVPAIDAITTTLGAERWIGESLLVSATLYARSTSGFITAVPFAGDLVERMRWVTGATRAHGVEVGARRLAGRLTGSVAYSYQRAELSSLDARFASPWLRPHVVQLTTALRAGRATFSAALAAASGSAFTTFFDGAVQCDSASAHCAWVTKPSVGELSELREPAYSSLDLAADWRARWRRADLMFYAQVNNVLGTNNPAAYLSSQCSSAEATGGCGNIVHKRIAGIRRLPAAGLRFVF
jgi:hypothetical protein